MDTAKPEHEVLRSVIERLGISQRAFAYIVNYDERTVRRWFSAQDKMPDDVASWVQELCYWLGDNPVPRRVS